LLPLFLGISAWQTNLRDGADIRINTFTLIFKDKLGIM